jgi:hypothetical protein
MIQTCLLAVVLLAMAAVVQAQFTYTTTNARLLLRATPAPAAQ